jgi:hypothetical protein
MTRTTKHTIRLGIVLAASMAFTAGGVAVAAGGGSTGGSSGGGSVVSSGGGGGAPSTASTEDMRLVIKDVTILDASGATLEQSHCEWTDPGEDDAPCMAFSGDPKPAYDAIKAAGGSSAVVETRIPAMQYEGRTTISQRADGTWLFSGERTEGGKTVHHGFVCSAEGRACTPYEGATARSAKRDAKRATKRMKKRLRARK